MSCKREEIAVGGVGVLYKKEGDCSSGHPLTSSPATMSVILSLFLLSAGASAVFAGYECTLIPGKLRQIDAGAGKIYGVDSAENIYNWVNNTWKQIPGALIHVSVGPAGVWGVNKQNTIYRLQDNKWTFVSNKLFKSSLQQLDAGGDKYVVGVNFQGRVYCLNENYTVSTSSYVIFTNINGSLTYYSCGLCGCWGVNKAQNIYFRENVTSNACQGSKWQQVNGSLRMLEVGTDCSVYGVDSFGHVYRREGITRKTPTGTSWTLLNICANITHVTHDNKFLWLLSGNDNIYRCTEVK